MNVVDDDLPSLHVQHDSLLEPVHVAQGKTFGVENRQARERNHAAVTRLSDVTVGIVCLNPAHDVFDLKAGNLLQQHHVGVLPVNPLDDFVNFCVPAVNVPACDIQGGIARR